METIMLVSPYLTTRRTIPFVLCTLSAITELSKVSQSNKISCWAFFSFFAHPIPDQTNSIMWRRLGQFILKYRFPLLFLLIAVSVVMGYFASKVELSYEFSRAIPANHPANITYQEFRKKFGEDGNLLVIGVQTKEIFSEKFFNAYASLQRQLK